MTAKEKIDLYLEELLQHNKVYDLDSKDKPISSSAGSIRQALLPLFKAEILADNVAERFVIPDMYHYLLQKLQHQFIRIGNQYGFGLFDVASVIRGTSSWAKGEVKDASPQEIWIQIGEEGDKHWYFLCCDAESQYFGKIADGYDNTPWNNYESLEVDFDSIVSFVYYAYQTSRHKRNA